MSAKKRSRFKTYGLPILAGLVALGAVLAWWDYRRFREANIYFRLGDVTKLEIRFEGKTYSLSRNQGPWEIDAVDGRPTDDRRANDGLIRHLIDMAREIQRLNDNDLNPKAAPQFGLDHPRLALSFGWTSPSRGEEALLYGNTTPDGHGVYVFLPKHTLLIQSPSTILSLLKDKHAEDLRDRRVFTFDHDDIEDLQTTGKCLRLSLHREGDHWRWNQGAPAGLPKEMISRNDVIDQWLEQFLRLGYSSRQDRTNGPLPHPVCTIHLDGLNQRSEILEIDAAGVAVNSKLASRFQLSPQALKELHLR